MRGFKLKRIRWLILSFFTVLQSGNAVATENKVEIFTASTRGDSYTVCVSIAIENSEASRTSFAEKMQAIYDHHNLRLTYEDGGKFWQLPHVTLVMFEKVKREDIEAFEGIFDQLSGIILAFSPEFFNFFGRGDQLVAMPHQSFVTEAKKLNAQIIDWVNKNIDSTQYKVCRNTLNKTFKPHLALNTSVPHKNFQGRVQRILGKALQSTTIQLNQVSITATNEWS